MNVHQQYESFDEILLLRERCTECCAGSYKSFHCPFCSTSKFKPAKECKLLSHLESHWKNRLAVGNGLCCLFIMKKNLLGRTKYIAEITINQSRLTWIFFLYKKT